MKIDRLRFLALVACTESLLAACGGGQTQTEEPEPAPVESTTAQSARSQPSDVGTTTQGTTETSAQPLAEGDCNQRDPTGECIGWVGFPSQAPSCVQYDPSGECVQWAPVSES